MSINLTLIVQMLVFALLIWFTMTFVWPIILGAMEERAKRIADGLGRGGERSEGPGAGASRAPTTPSARRAPRPCRSSTRRSIVPMS